MSRVIQKLPYSLLAQVYDRIQPHRPEINRRARQVVLKGVLPKVHSVCDLGCGTGITAVELAKRGLQVVGIDKSPHMCRLTRERARRAGLPVKVLCADMRRFRLPSPVDLVLCEFSGLGHMKGRGDLWRVVRRVAEALSPGGFFYFDVLPTGPSRQSSCNEWVREKGDLMVCCRTVYDPGLCREEIEINWFTPVRGLWRRYRERMRVAHWSTATIRDALRRAGFRRVRVFDGTPFRTRPGMRLGTYFLAQKTFGNRSGN
jgi:SAM-dependent methyltransferase